MDDSSTEYDRLDQIVVGQRPDFSRSFAVKLIQKGQVKVNDVVQTKAGFKTRPKDVVVVDFDEADYVPPELDISIVYEDDDCVVINKPEGVLSHSKGAFNPEATVATWLERRAPQMNGDRAGIVHRLDRATSGVMICAKTPEALSWLQKQFSQRRVKKVYQAVVAGSLKQPKAVIDLPIERNPKKPQTFRVGVNGKAAVTEYEVISEADRFSLIELRPTSGRTHQLRVHLSHLGHPIVGDSLYGGKPSERMFLHAKSLELTLPSKKRQVFEVPVPSEFQEMVR